MEQNAVTKVLYSARNSDLNQV